MKKNHGIPMHGLQAASKQTKDYTGTRKFVEIAYDTAKGEVISKVWEFNPGENSHRIFGENVIPVLKTDEHIRMDDLACAVMFAVNHARRNKIQ